jgi:aryl-alcohol dehydrogenase-like predicted oxidoreductase
VTKSLEDSLRRLELDRVDIFHLHNEITIADGRESLSIKRVLGEVVPTFEKLKQRGMTRLLGITALGDTPALHEAIDSNLFDSAQVCYNMLNPSAGAALPPNYPAQDYRQIFDHTRAAGIGVIGIRVLAGGALTGIVERHPIAGPPPLPIGSASSYAADVARAQRLLPLVKEGFAGSLGEAATRLAISHPAMGTILVGMATQEQFEQALTAIQKGPLPKSALERLATLQEGFVGEWR